MAEPNSASFHGIIGRSAAMRALFDRIEQVAPLRVPVLIQGESGTGKELVATAIQRLSTRSERPFERVNCADFTRHSAGAREALPILAGGALEATARVDRDSRARGQQHRGRLLAREKAPLRTVDLGPVEVEGP